MSWEQLLDEEGFSQEDESSFGVTGTVSKNNMLPWGNKEGYGIPDGIAFVHTDNPSVINVVNIGFGAVCPNPQRLPFLVQFARFSSSSRSFAFPLPEQILFMISSIRLVPTRQKVHFPHDSLCVKERKYLAISTMQLVSSIMTIPPEPIIAPVLLIES